MNFDYDKFKSLESEVSVFDIDHNGIPIWERIRYPVLREIQIQRGMGDPHTRMDHNVKNYSKGLYLFARNLFMRNPYLARGEDVAFVGHPRRKKGNDGEWWDIYCDPIIDYSDFNVDYFEFANDLSHHQPAHTDAVRYLDLIRYGGRIQRKLGIKRPNLPSSLMDELRIISEDINQKFDVSVNVDDLVKESLHQRKTDLLLYKILLDRLDPDSLVLVTSYGKETLIEACKEKSIPVIEIQHGIISEYHVGYSYEGDKKKMYFPDYLLTFGEYWKDSTEFPIPDENIYPVGYPHLEKSINKYGKGGTGNTILFISQGTIGEKLSKFAVQLDKHPENPFHVKYKLHPGEYDRWTNLYPWLLDSDIKIIGDSETGLHKLFSTSCAQIGVNSTALYEGLAFDLDTYIYDCPESRVLQPLINSGAAREIRSVDELISSSKRNSGHFDRRYYFSQDAKEKAVEKIKQISEGEIQ